MKTALIVWVLIPGGTFQMGSTQFPDEQPIHAVTVKAFELGRTEVTNRQYQLCVLAGACTVPDLKCLGPAFRGLEQPVVCVTWAQARAFAAWAGGRLPTEAELEHAARGGDKRRYAWGDEKPTCKRAVFEEREGAPGCGRGATWPVCSKPLGRSKHGLCDLAGNVWEWAEDWWHNSYEGAPSDGSAWTANPSPEMRRADRGGAWNGDAHNLRVSTRDREDPEIHSERGTGLRVARDAR